METELYQTLELGFLNVTILTQNHEFRSNLSEIGVFLGVNCKVEQSQ